MNAVEEKATSIGVVKPLVKKATLRLGETITLEGVHAPSGMPFKLTLPLVMAIPSLFEFGLSGTF
jgi:hypothetical protein